MSVSYGGDTITFADNSTISSGWTGFKNRIINGAMAIDQRNASANVAADANGSYPVDRFSMRRNSGGGEYTGQQVSAPAGSKFNKALKLVVTTADSSIAAGEYYVLRTKIEGYNIADLLWGTASASPITLSFEVNASVAGTYSVSVCNYNNARSYVATFTVNSPNTTETKNITIPGDTSGTWYTDNGIGIDLLFNIGMGSTYTTSSTNSWQGATYYAATGQTQLISTVNATFQITGLQLEKGSTASSFEYRPLGTELALCQRYYFKQIHSTTQSCAYGHVQTTNLTRATYTSPVPMRTTPAWSSNANNYWLDTSISQSFTTASTIDHTGCNIVVEATVSGAYGGRFGVIYAYNGYTQFSAEM